MNWEHIKKGDTIYYEVCHNRSGYRKVFTATVDDVTKTLIKFGKHRVSRKSGITPGDHGYFTPFRSLIYYECFQELHPQHYRGMLNDKFRALMYGWPKDLNEETIREFDALVVKGKDLIKRWKELENGEDV